MRHKFEENGSGTKMTDVFEFHAPLGVLGKFAEWLFLKAYMRRFLLLRNEEIKRIAESELRKELPGFSCALRALYGDGSGLVGGR
jgi:hypothetical protein